MVITDGKPTIAWAAQRDVASEKAICLTPEEVQKFAEALRLGIQGPGERHELLTLLHIDTPDPYADGPRLGLQC